jgi:hypothetical protein
LDYQRKKERFSFEDPSRNNINNTFIHDITRKEQAGISVFLLSPKFAKGLKKITDVTIRKIFIAKLSIYFGM